MLGCLFILASLSGILLNISTVVLLVIEPQQCKFYASVMKSKIYSICRGFHCQVLWPDLKIISYEITVKAHLLKKYHSEFKKKEFSHLFFAE